MTDEPRADGPQGDEPATDGGPDADAGQPNEPNEPNEPNQPNQPRRPLRLTWRALVPVITAVAGIMFSMSFVAAQGQDLRADRDLPQLIMEGDSRVADKAAQLDTLQREVEALSKANAPYDKRLATLTAKGDALADAAADTKVTGPAIEVTLDDAHRSVDSLPDGFTGDDIVVHQQDVQGVVNALWRSGAEAMMIQDQRIISTSAVRCVGNTLILQGRVYSPPYRIKAIGDVQSLQLGLDNDQTVQIYKQYVDAVGLGYGVQTHASEQFPAYSGPVDLQYAAPIR